MQGTTRAAPAAKAGPGLRHLIRGTRGQSLAEFALLLPVLLILVLGAIDFGRVYFAYVSVTNASRNAAQYGSFNTIRANDEDCTDGNCLRLAAIADTSNLLNTSSTNPEVTTESCSVGSLDDQGNECVRITVTYTFETLVPWPGLPNSIDLSRTVQMRVAELPGG